jgi:hypothetical protein
MGKSSHTTGEVFAPSPEIHLKVAKHGARMKRRGVVRR